MTHNIAQSLQRDIIRALRNHKYEASEEGILLPQAHVFLGGAFRHAHAPAGGDFAPWQVDPNKVVLEGLIYMLNAAFGGASQITAWFLAPFSCDAEPQDEWKASTFATVATEFTGYTSSTRLPWTITQASSAASIGNSANVSASTLTFSAAGDIYGIALLSSNAKSGTTGKLGAASQFAAARTNMAIGDKLAMEYVLSATDES